MSNKPKLPIILYEEPTPGQPANPIPYVEIGISEEMPPVLFVSEYKETGEYEPDPQFGSRPIVDMLIHKYVDLDYLKTKLDSKTNDKVRVALGMKPLKQAQKDGKKILTKVYANAQANKITLETNQEAQSERVFQLGEKIKNKMAQILEQQKNEKE